MTPEEEHAIRSQLKWKRDGSDWVLLRGRRRMGRVTQDLEYPRHVAHAEVGRSCQRYS